MLMCKQMILTILIISIAFGTKSEFQVRIILLCSAADRAFVLGDTACCRIDPALCDCFLELSSSVNFFRIIAMHVSCAEEEQHEVQKRGNDRNHIYPESHPQISNHILKNHYAIDDRHPFHLDRDHKPQKDLHIRA